LIQNIEYQPLIDINSNGKVTDWQGKKLRTIELADSYRRLGYENKYYRVRDCGTFLEFRRYQDQSLKLNQANFCKVRLCPMCSWRRSLKIYGQVSKIMDEAVKNEELEFIFLTLTTRNCEGQELSTTIDNIFKAFNKMTKRVKYKKAIRGHFRALEVTHNLNYMSDWFDTYHPHLHIILVVNKSYFTDTKIYISQEEWTDIWKQSLKVDYTPLVHVTKVKDTNNKGIEKIIAETAKYTVKSDDYIVREDITNEIIEAMTDDAVFILDKALAHRRLTAFGGILKEYHKMLNLDDMEDGDLVNTDNEYLREDLEFIIERYSWNIGYNQYLRIKE
jgi:plasmid rolling circle replication initiator protein Rep